MLGKLKNSMSRLPEDVFSKLQKKANSHRVVVVLHFAAKN